MSAEPPTNRDPASDTPTPSRESPRSTAASPAEPPPDAPKHESLGEVLKRLGPASVLAVIAGTLPAIGGFLLLGTMQFVGPWLREHGALGVALYIAGFIVLAGLALLPTYAQAILAGWAFGFAVGFPAALTGFLGAALLGYTVALFFTGQRVVRLIDEHPRWRAVYDALLGGGFGRTLFLVTLLRLPPNSPFAMTNLLLAATRIPISVFALGTLLGMAPRTGLAVFFAAGVKELMLERGENRWIVVLGFALTAAVVIYIGYIANRALARATRDSGRSKAS